RIYDYILGGKDNFAADRQAARQLLAALPDIAGTVRDNRAFIGRVVRFLAGQAGISQFLDLGAGLPTQDCVHEMAQAIAPDARVERVTDVYRNASAQIHVRPVKDIERFFDGWEILEPGVVWMARWRPDPGTRPAGRPNSLYGGVGRKPGA